MGITGRDLQRIARTTAEELPGVDHGRPFVEKLDVYKVAGKVFLIVTDDPNERIITVKIEPDHGQDLRKRYESVVPGRYLDKTHWISLRAGPEITSDLIDDLVAHSYALVLAAMPRRHRPEGAERHDASPGPQVST